MKKSRHKYCRKCWKKNIVAVFRMESEGNNEEILRRAEAKKIGDDEDVAKSFFLNGCCLGILLTFCFGHH